MPQMDQIDQEQALGFLLRFLAIEGTTGNEEAIGREIATVLGDLGVPAEAIRWDDAERRIPLPTQTGNLIVSVAGDSGIPPKLFAAHRDTVPLCAGAQPVVAGDRVVPRGPTALGGDNRAGVACLVTMLATLQRHRLQHGPLTLVFTVREESGLWGARQIDTGLLGRPPLAFNVDGPSPAALTIGAAGAALWEVEIEGRAAHAGLHPEQGISAPLIAASALAAIHRQGWFGKILRQDRQGTSNVGSLCGRDGGSVGGPTNVVTDYVKVAGEARSHDGKFGAQIVSAYRRAFSNAARRMRNASGATAEVAFRSEELYHAFRLDPASEVVRFALDRAAAAGLEPSLRISDAGLDANWFVRHGLPMVTFGVGQRNIHSTAEHLDLADFFASCRLALSLARA